MTDCMFRTKVYLVLSLNMTCFSALFVIIFFVSGDNVVLLGIFRREPIYVGKERSAECGHSPPVFTVTLC